MPSLGEANDEKYYDKQLVVYLKNQDDPIILYHFTEDFFNQILAMIQNIPEGELKEKFKGIKNLNLQEIFLSTTQGHDVEISYPFMIGMEQFYFYYSIPYNNIEFIRLVEATDQNESEGGDVL